MLYVRKMASQNYFLCLLAICCTFSDCCVASGLKSKVEGLEKMMLNLQSLYKLSQLENDQLKSRVELIQNENDQRADENERLKSRLDLIQNENDQRADENENLKSRLDLIQKANERLNARLDKYDELFDACEDKLSLHVSQVTEERVHGDKEGFQNDSSLLSKISEKRSDDLGNLEPVVVQLTQRLDAVSAEVQAMKSTAATYPTGSTYTRWGSNTCPSSAETLYSGEMGGGDVNSPGSPINHLCLSDNPVFDNHNPTSSSSELWGAEYETSPEVTHQSNPSCAVCRTTRSSVVILPATNLCQSGWHLEYSGYMMAGHKTQAASTEFICVDSSLGYRPNSQANDNGALLYYTIAHCGSLSCPPYINNKLILCAVCSK